MGETHDPAALRQASLQQSADEIAMLRDSLLVDEAWYVVTYPDIAGQDAVAHFHLHGWREGRRPNAYFETTWYLQQNPDVAAADLDPLLHYLSRGEQEQRPPCPAFDLAWYATCHQPEHSRSLLVHFLARRYAGTVSPMAGFDPRFYLERYPDIAAAGVDPFEHYLNWGYREGRNPSAAFDTLFYTARYLPPGSDENPLLHHQRAGKALGLRTAPNDTDVGVFPTAAGFCRVGPQFESLAPLPRAARPAVMALAYYLPQFHRIAENDAWWGPGFTEWTAIGRGLPRFAGHYQPRLPGALGHYSLADPATMHVQAALARGAGLHGFVHYFYWFNGRRLLEAPIEAMLADHALDMPFCLMWANENWTRRWDGADDQVLMRQDYSPEDDVALVDCLARHFRDPRYIRIQGRPVLMVYRPAVIPDAPTAVRRWRSLFAERHFEDPILVMSQSFGAEDPRRFGFDGAIEFPPHKLVNGLQDRRSGLTWFDRDATAQVFAYDDVAKASLQEPAVDFPLIKTAVPGWDNDARRGGHGMVLHGATPAKYQAWLEALAARALLHPFFGQPMLCVNAWNEWAEGAYLEPDMHFGAAYLNATGRALTAVPAIEGGALLLVGHDAFRAGAQMLLLHVARSLVRSHGLRVEILLLGGGVLLEDYAAVAPTTVLADLKALADWAAAGHGRGLRAALVNTSAAAWTIPKLVEAGLRASLLVHELPRLIEEKKLLPGLQAGVMKAERVIFACAAVRDAIAALAPIDPARILVAPQGQYLDVAFSAAGRERLRALLGVGPDDVLVLGAGHADLRKGFDLFLHAWRAARRQGAAATFCWIGEIDPGLGYLQRELDDAVATGRFHLPGHCSDVADYYSAADVLALTSREDPFPTVVLEAMAAGLPCVAFEGSGGIPDLLHAQSCGVAVPMGDTHAMAARLLELGAAGAAARPRLAAQARRNFDFPRYAAMLLQVAMPELADISVMVPSYNYAGYLPARLGSIFAQVHPVREILVLDDASTDGSAELAVSLAKAAGREIRLHISPINSGSVFRQWRRGAELAQGRFLWIAEADDDADPDLLATLAARLQANPDLDMAMCDSRAIDADGQALQDSYQDYYASSGAAVLARDGIYPAAEFARRFLAERNLLLNASAVVWRRSALLAALTACDDLPRYRLAGDWRIYLAVMAASTGQVAWVARPLNIHRRHAGSVTGALAAADHLDEIARIHAVARSQFGADPQLADRQAAYLREVEAMLQPPQAA